MRCVHMHQRILAIEGCGNLNCVKSDVERTREYNRTTGKISQVVN
jgi:uncharacterized metal-binding protein